MSYRFGVRVMRVGTVLQTDAPAATGDTSPTKAYSSAAMHPLRTYLVEDSPVIRESLIAALEELGPVEVVGTAEDEACAVQWLTQPGNQFDLVIIDIFLKGGSGLGVLRAANALAPRRNMVVLSNYATPDMRRKCLEMGADRVFDKSNEIEALVLYCARLAGGDTSAGPPD